jgi:hypothetical protein
MGILVVDNTVDGAGQPFEPTDQQVDSFYSTILGEYNVQAHWEVSDSADAGRFMMDYDIGVYSAVVWHKDHRSVTHIPTDTTTMRKYLDGGGDLWLSGWKLLASLTGNSQSYYDFENGDLMSDYIGLDSAKTTPSYIAEMVGVESPVEGFPTIPVDPVKVSPLGALFDTEILLPPFNGTYSLYTYISSDSVNSEYHGLPVAVASNSTDYGLVVTDFPLYYLDLEGAGLLAGAVMDLFGESLSADGDRMAGLPRAYSLSQNYPNPFNPLTTIEYDIPDQLGDGAEVKIRVYDIRGRLIRTLLNESRKPGTYRVVWDGQDESGSEVASGVYLYSIEAGEFSSTRKMVLLR